MIRVRVRCGPGGAELTAQGHAGYAPAGQDIVCAAVSSVLYTLAGLLDANGELEAFAQGEGSTRIAARGERGTKKRGARGGDTAGAGGAVAGVPAGGGNGV